MKRKISFGITFLVMLSLLLLALTACGNKECEHLSSGAPTATQDEVCTKCGYVINEAIGISFKTLTVDGNNVFGKVSNDTTYYSFIDEINAVGGAKYIVSRNITGTDWLPAKTVDLAVGDNTIYIIEMINDEPSAIYTVVIRRRPVYTVTFDANGGTSVETQYVEEEEFAAIPETTYAGYTFTGWNYDFGTPIMSDTHITANWKANTETKYTVEYYLENLDKSDYELIDTDELTGTTDTRAKALIKEFEHFTFNSTKSVTSGNIDGDGSLVLKVYYTKDTYQISINISEASTLTGGGTYAYGNSATVSLSSTNLGYRFLGWYSGDKLISSETTYTAVIDRNIEARFEILSEMQSFNFTSTATTCTITGIKDKTVTEIIVPDYVTTISGGAFSSCTSLTSVTIPDSVTSIGSYAFYNCRSLVSVTIPDSVETLGEYAFAYCSKLSELTLGNSIKLIGEHAFSNCTSLTSVTIGDSVETLGEYAFAYCSELSELTLGNSIKLISSSAFYYCTSLTSVTIPDSVTNIGSSAFSNCTSLVSVTIPDSVTSIGSYAFYNCTSLMSVHITDIAKWCGISFDGFYANPLCYAHNLYLNGKLVTELVIPDGVTSIGDYAFYYCTSLARVTIGDGVTSIGYYAFRGCNHLTSVTFKNTNGWWYSSSSTATSGTSISASNLSNTSTAATYLNSTYYNYYWKRS